jgi:hypothetical protein
MREGFAPRKRRRRRTPQGERLLPVKEDSRATNELFPLIAPPAGVGDERSEFVIDLREVETADEPLPRHAHVQRRRLHWGASAQKG